MFGSLLSVVWHHVPGNFLLSYITSQKTMMLAYIDIATCSLLLSFHVESCLLHVFIFSCPCFVYFSHFVILSCHSPFSLCDLKQTYHYLCTIQRHFSSVTRVSTSGPGRLQTCIMLCRNQHVHVHSTATPCIDFSYVAFTFDLA